MTVKDKFTRMKLQFTGKARKAYRDSCFFYSKILHSHQQFSEEILEQQKGRHSDMSGEGLIND